MKKIARCGTIMVLAILFAGIVTAQTAANWTRQIPSNFPPAGVSLMAYDSAHGQVVLYQGETWTWDGSNWTKKSPANSPPARREPVMAYDSARGQVVLFGGYVANGIVADGTAPMILNDTWVWDGSDWTQKAPATSPPARYSHTMAYDSAHSQVVLFGGYNGSTPLNDTWVWNGSNWAQKSPQASPPARWAHGMAYDSAHNQTVVFSGMATSPGVFNDTWTWDGTNWTKKSPPNSPSTRQYVGMAYDSAHAQVVLFGGADTNFLGDTWTWDGSTWTQKSPQNSPGTRDGHAMAYDVMHGQVVLFGGFTGATGLQDTWTWNGGALTPQVNTSGIVNNASYTLGSAGSSVAPGSIAAIFGSNLTDGSSCLPPTCNPTFASNGKLNTTMAGAQVTVGGTPVPIFYATPTQLGIQIPFELAGTSAAVVVSVAGQSSVSSIVTVASVSPGIFTYTADGKGPGAITHANGSAVTAQSPAGPGEIVILYATGLGQVTPAVPTGALPAGASTSISPVMLNIGGIGVIPDYAGLSGCCVGLNQINARVPAGVTLGVAVPVVLNISGQSSNTATIAVQ